MIRRKTNVDSGYAWVILGSAFCVNAMSAITLVNGVLNVSFLEEFGRSHALTSWCFALQLGLCNVSGLVGSILAHRFGTRLTVMLGGLCLALGVFLTAVATSLTQVYISYGVLTGVGFGLTYAPATVTLGFYFDRYRNAAFGFVTMGVGVGVMIFGPLINYLIVLYTWRGAMLVLSAILANNIVYGALMRPPSIDTSEQCPYENNEVENDAKDKQLMDFYHSKPQENHPNYVGSGRKALSVKNLDKTEFICNQTKTCSLRSGLDLTSSFRDMLNVPTCHLSASFHRSAAVESTERQSVDQGDIQINKRDLSKCLHNSNDTTVNNKTNDMKSHWWILNPEFLALALHFFCIGVGLACIYIHFPAYVIQLGTSASHASILVSLMGCGNIIGRFGIGAITNIWKQQMMGIYICTCVISGLSALCGPLICKHLPGQVLFSVGFMMFGNCYISLMAPLSIHAVGLENLNIAFAIGLSSNGCGYLVGPTLAGWLFDITGSYLYTFVLAGACYLAASLVITITTITRYIKKATW